MRKEIHRLHAVMGQKRCIIGAFDNLSRIFEGGFRVAVFSKLLRWFFAYSAINSNWLLVVSNLPERSLLFSTSSRHGIFYVAGGFPLYNQFFAGVHYFPCAIAHHGNHFVESTGIETALFKTIIVQFKAKYIFDSGIFLAAVASKDFSFIPNAGGC